MPQDKTRNFSFVTVKALRITVAQSRVEREHSSAFQTCITAIQRTFVMLTVGNGIVTVLLLGRLGYILVKHYVSFTSKIARKAAEVLALSNDVVSVPHV